MYFFLQYAPNEIFKILKLFKYNMKFTRAACWIKNKQQRQKHHTHNILTVSLLLVIIVM